MHRKTRNQRRFEEVSVSRKIFLGRPTLASQTTDARFLCTMD